MASSQKWFFIAAAFLFEILSWASASPSQSACSSLKTIQSVIAKPARTTHSVEELGIWPDLDPDTRDLFQLISKSVRFSIQEVPGTEEKAMGAFRWSKAINPKTNVPSRRLTIPSSLSASPQLKIQGVSILRKTLSEALADVTVENWLIQDYSLWMVNQSRSFVELKKLCTELMAEEAVGKSSAVAKKEILSRYEKISSPEAIGLFKKLSKPREPDFKTLRKLLKSYRLRNDLSVPKKVEALVYAEQNLNDLTLISNSPIDSSTLPASFTPTEGNIFELPFMVLKPSEVQALGVHLPEIAKMKNGSFRFFMHPQNFQFFSSLIETHPLHYKGHVATPLSSGRSLIAWNLKNPDQTLFSVKTGLDAMIGREFRKMPPAEALHATMISDELSRIPPEYFKKIGLQPFFEPGALVPNGFESSDIFKDLGEISNGETEHYLPMFSLYSAASEKERSLIFKLAKAAGKDPLTYAKEDVLHPLIQALSKFYADYGFIPEPHGQNLLVKISGGKITGFGFRDFSGVAVDTDLRKLRNLRNDFIEQERIKHPDIFKSAYHVDRGATYLDRGIDAHFKITLLKGFASSLHIPIQDLAAFADAEFKRQFAAEIGVPEFPEGSGWAEGVRKAIRDSGSH